nr:response regulator [Leptolyngbya sp. FACHB-36]
MKSNKNLLTVTKSLLPYIQQGLVKLLDIEDFKPFTYLAVPELVQSSLVQAPSPKSFVEPSLDAPLIAYVDDYKVDGQTMNQILTNMGYRFIHIQDPLQALPLLLEHKPKLVFLDLVMPIVNGYEACAQIRRVSRFKDTPIIILTSNDGIVDRVRAKIVGSTGFLSKPIDPKKVQAVVQKYLGRE